MKRSNDSAYDNLMQLAQQIAKLEGKLDMGFAGINQRLDFSNGRLSKHDALIASLQNSQSEEKGEKKGVRISWGFVVTVATLIAACLGGLVYFK